MSALAPPAPPLLRRPAPVAVAACTLSALALARFGLEPRALVAAFVLSTLTVLSAVDVERRIIPNRIVLPAACVVLVAQTALSPDRAPEWVLAALGTALLLLLPLLGRPGAMGMGDVKLGLLLGAALGRDVVGALLLGAVAAMPVALYVLARGGHDARRASIPYGPFLSLGAALVLLSG